MIMMMIVMIMIMMLIMMMRIMMTTIWVLRDTISQLKMQISTFRINF